jgi:hypothetical protein
MSECVPRDLVLSSDEIAARYIDRRGAISITAAFCGDPVFSRSALGGWVQRGDGESLPMDISHGRKRKFEFSK